MSQTLRYSKTELVQIVLPTYTREDGAKQWASRGHALWTYDGDIAPGDINGNDAYELKLAHDAETVIDIGTPYDGSWALFWIAAYP